MNEERVRLEVSDHVAAVTLARPEKHNALDPAMFEAIVEAAEQVADTPGVRAVVLHGDGPSFCSGIDVTSAFSRMPGPTADSRTCSRRCRTASSAPRTTGSRCRFR